MRWLMNFTLGFGAACFCCVCPLTWYLLLLFLAGMVLFRKRLSVFLILAGILAGNLWFCAYDTIFLEPIRTLDGVTQEVTIRASDYSFETAYGMAVDGEILVDSRSYQVRTYLDPGKIIQPGESLRGEFQFRLTTPDAKEEVTHHSGKGIFLLAYQKSDITRREGEAHWRDIPAKLRLQIENILDMYFQEDTAPFAKALLLGDASDLSYAVDTDLKVSGIRHVAAVSGLHVSILFALVSTLTLRRRWLTALLGFPALLLFAALAGFTPSVVRSCIMCALMLLAMLADQEYDGPTALSFAVLTMLVVNPLVITSVSLQLSAASVAGIFLFQGKIQPWFLAKGLPKWAASSFAITISAMSLTTPLCAWYFGMVSLVGILTNLLTLWIISTIFYGILLVCLLHFLIPTLAGVAAMLIAWPIRYVLGAAKALAGLPLSAVYTESIYVVFWLVFVYALLLLWERNAAVLSCCAVLGLCISLLASCLEPGLDDVRFTVLDVGQGQCLLFQTEGKTILVDCGGDSDTASADLAAETLLSQGIHRIDAMILTHLDDDHAGGAENLLSRMETDLLVLPWTDSDLDTGKAEKVLYADQNLELTLEDTKIRIYSPGFPGNGNEMSLCVLFDTKICDILVTGDRSGSGEKLLLERNEIPKVDILVAGHHGAGDSTTAELLSAVQPEIVCISAGKDNPYGHPDPELLTRLSRFGCQIYRTDQQSTITIRR